MTINNAGGPKAGLRIGLRAWLAAAVAGVVLVPVHAQAAHVYLLRGFAGVFSTGLDDLAEQLSKRGYKATVHSYTEADTLAAEAAREQKAGKGPIILIGHSYGAEAAFGMAEDMKKQGASVALIVSYAPTVSVAAPSNVHAVVNYYQGDVPITKGPGFHGSLNNVNLDNSDGVNHFNVEKIAKFQKQVIARVRAIASAH
jgi:alpha-beta hydrolase superfamily lysophospholipase